MTNLSNSGNSSNGNNTVTTVPVHQSNSLLSNPNSPSWIDKLFGQVSTISNILGTIKVIKNGVVLIVFAVFAGFLFNRALDTVDVMSNNQTENIKAIFSDNQTTMTEFIKQQETLNKQFLSTLELIIKSQESSGTNGVGGSINCVPNESGEVPVLGGKPQPADYICMNNVVLE